jgi:rRNA maturation RNase YbeY
MSRSEKLKSVKKPVRVYKAYPGCKLSAPRLKDTIRRVLEAEAWDLAVEVIIADDRELQRLHARFLGDDSPTDVISFPGDAKDDTPAEIYISLDQARLQAEEGGEPVERVLDRLLVHGLLHLGGWKDNTKEQRRRMIKYGEQYLK